MTTPRQTKSKDRPTKAAQTKQAKTASRRGARTVPTAETGHGVTIPVPIVTPHLKVLHPSVPGTSSIGHAGRSMARRIPPPGRLAFYGGLGAAATFGVIDWPVALAIGVGLAIAGRARAAGRPRSAVSSAGRPEAGSETAEHP